MLFIGADGSSPQIAAGLLRQLSEDRIAVDTVATQPGDPGGRADEMLVAMGLDPATDGRLTPRALHTADRVVALGTGLDVARLPGPRYEEWDLEQGDLATRVEALGDDLVNPPLRPSWWSRVRARLRLRQIGAARRHGAQGSSSNQGSRRR